MQNTYMREDKEDPYGILKCPLPSILMLLKGMSTIQIKVIDEMSLYEYSPSRKDSTIHNAIFI